MHQMPFDLPSTVILDDESGYAVNVPLIHQGYPYWWEDNPEAVARIMTRRRELGIEVDDFPNGSLPERRTDIADQPPAGRPG